MRFCSRNWRCAVEMDFCRGPCSELEAESNHLSLRDSIHNDVGRNIEVVVTGHIIFGVVWANTCHAIQEGRRVLWWLGLFWLQTGQEK